MKQVKSIFAVLLAMLLCLNLVVPIVWATAPSNSTAATEEPLESISSEDIPLEENAPTEVPVESELLEADTASSVLEDIQTANSPLANKTPVHTYGNYIDPIEVVNVYDPSTDYNQQFYPGHGVHIHYLDGRPCYCIQPNVPSNGDVIFTQNQANAAWANLSAAQRESIALTMAYGCPYYGSWYDTSISQGNREYEILATQLIIWEIIAGYRQPSSLGTTSKNLSSFWGPGPSESWDLLHTMYNNISNRLAKHGKFPSFTDTIRNAAPTHTLTRQSDGTYRIVLTDTNGVLSDFTFQSTVSGLTFSKSGNTLTITATAEAAQKLSGGVVFTATGSIPQVDGSSVLVYQQNEDTQACAMLDAKPEAKPCYFKLQADVSGDLQIIKTSDDGKVTGITFTIEEWVPGIGYCRIGTYTTDTNGKITVSDLLVGTKYRVTETVPDGYEAEQQSQEITIQPGTNKLTFVNHLAARDLEIIKTSTDGNVSGIPFTVKDSSSKIVSTGKTDSSGKLTIPGLRIGATYTVTETVPIGYICTNNSQKITIVEGTNTVTFENQLVTGSLQILKVDHIGQTPLEGAGFRVFDSTGKQVAEGYTDYEGKLTFDDLRYGNYTYQEFAAPEGFELDETVYDFSILQNGQVISVQHENIAMDGSIRIYKVNAERQPLSGVSFLLEYSIDDGQTYQPVFLRGKDDPVSVGGCTSEGLQDGILTTGGDGITVFSGLRINTQTGNIVYRLTEIFTQEGYQLLSDPVFESELPYDSSLDVEFTVVNNHIYTLPATGGTGFSFVPLALCLFGLIGSITTLALRKKKQEA